MNHAEIVIAIGGALAFLALAFGGMILALTRD